MAQTYHHPNGYDDDRLLDVIPLCYKCHAAEHKRIGWYTGTIAGHEKEIVTAFKAGVSIRSLSLKYRAPITVIRDLVRVRTQLRLALLFP